MKYSNNLFRIILPAALILFTGAAAPVKKAYTLSGDYSVSIHGTSNLHSWVEKVESVSGDGMVSWNKDGSFDLENINLKLEVHSIKSDNGSIMNNKTYEALKADRHPQIIFRLGVPVRSIQTKAEKTISAKGHLTIAGVTRPVDMKVKVLMNENERLSLEGSQVIKMSDYAVVPPEAFFGSLKTGNEITLYYKISFTTENNLTKNNQPVL